MNEIHVHVWISLNLIFTRKWNFVRKENNILYIFHLFLRHDSLIIPQYILSLSHLYPSFFFLSFIKQFFKITIFQNFNANFPFDHYLNLRKHYPYFFSKKRCVKKRGVSLLISNLMHHWWASWGFFKSRWSRRGIWGE